MAARDQAAVGQHVNRDDEGLDIRGQIANPGRQSRGVGILHGLFRSIQIGRGADSRRQHERPLPAMRVRHCSGDLRASGHGQLSTRRRHMSDHR